MVVGSPLDLQLRGATKDTVSLACQVCNACLLLKSICFGQVANPVELICAGRKICPRSLAVPNSSSLTPYNRYFNRDLVESRRPNYSTAFFKKDLQVDGALLTNRHLARK